MIVTIRRGKAADAEDIACIYMQSARRHAVLDSERYYVPDPAAVVERYRTGAQHATPEGVTLVAETGDKVAGFVDVRLERPHDAMHRPALYCYIAEIAVREDLRSRGIGRQLIAAAEEWGRASGAEFAALDYVAANTRAADFYYQRMGYRHASVVAVKRLA